MQFAKSNIYIKNHISFNRKEWNNMKAQIHTHNTFKSVNTEKLKKEVTTKVEKLINIKIKKVG